MNKKELFERHFKGDMLSLVKDKVSNVRMSLAKVLRAHFLNHINGNHDCLNHLGALINDQEVNMAVQLLK